MITIDDLIKSLDNIRDEFDDKRCPQCRGPLTMARTHRTGDRGGVIRTTRYCPVCPPDQPDWYCDEPA